MIGITGYISTHTLTWSVTDSREQKWGHIEISTHTLTWSVTDSVSGSGDITNNFNSHAHVERDRSQLEYAGISYEFQLTRSRGA